MPDDLFEKAMLSLEAHCPLTYNWTKQPNYLGVMLQIMVLWDELNFWEKRLLQLPVLHYFAFQKR